MFASRMLLLFGAPNLADLERGQVNVTLALKIKRKKKKKPENIKCPLERPDESGQHTGSTPDALQRIPL